MAGEGEGPETQRVLSRPTAFRRSIRRMPARTGHQQLRNDYRLAAIQGAR